jgi:hypothetical protein
MRPKLRTVVFGGLIAGSLMMSSAPAMARDYWHWRDNDHRWERRAEIRSEQRDLAQARRQLAYDRAHHASRRTIAQDEVRIRQIEQDLREDRRLSRR